MQCTEGMIYVAGGVEYNKRGVRMRRNSKVNLSRVPVVVVL